jgi:hypothetical protein
VQRRLYQQQFNSDRFGGHAGELASRSIDRQLCGKSEPTLTAITVGEPLAWEPKVFDVEFR